MTLSHRLGLLAAASSLALMGCSSGEGTVVASSTTVPSSTYPVGAEWRYSFDWASPQAYYKSSYDLYQSTIAVCMREAGFSYEPVAYVDTDSASALLNPLNEAIASKYGYMTPPDAQVEDPNHGDDAWYAALTDSDGCSNVALTYAYHGEAGSRFSDLFDPLVADADHAIAGFESADDGNRLLAAWSSCMAESGYGYRTPRDAASDVSETLDQTHRRVRLADLACDREVGLTKQRSLFEQRAIQGWADRNAIALDELRSALRDAQLEVADRQEALAKRGAAVLESVEAFHESGEAAAPG